MDPSVLWYWAYDVSWTKLSILVMAIRLLC